jgi:hypothetical protein
MVSGCFDQNSVYTTKPGGEGFGFAFPIREISFRVKLGKNCLAGSLSGGTAGGGNTEVTGGTEEGEKGEVGLRPED